jgi:quercetin dioxygenase-like cupin family protein
MLDEFLVLQVLDGKANISTAEGEFEVKKKNAVTFHPGVSHSIEALSKTILLLTTFNSKNEF